MKRITLYLIVFLFCIKLNAQIDSTYQALIAEAGLFHLQKDYKNAIISFEKAFEIHKPDALNAYKAAGVYSLNNDTDKAFYHLEFALENGWTEADFLSFDPYFDNLKKTFPDEWKQIEQKAFTKEKQYQQTLKFPELRRRINLMTLNDQKIRVKKIQTSDQNEIQLLNQQINLSDLKNLNEAKEIIKKYGWPKISEIGKDGENNFWLIVQHSDQDVKFQKFALSKMESFVGTKEIDMENYAFLYDRVQCNLNYKQLYGTQVIWTENGKASGFRPILKENLVDNRRSLIGLLPLRIYSLTYGFKYRNITDEQARKNDLSDLKYTQGLIDSAQVFYKLKQFQKVYDYYNNASTVLGGMTNLQNYDAAVLFAKIYNITNEEQYRSISLDFLTLLYYRDGLTKKKLIRKKEFEKFYSEKRWKDIIQNI